MSLNVKELTKPSSLASQSGVRPTAVKPSRRAVLPSQDGKSPEPQAKAALANNRPDSPGLLGKIDKTA